VENDEKCQFGKLVSWPKFEPVTSQIGKGKGIPVTGCGGP
jgi:hypothetical protein